MQRFAASLFVACLVAVGASAGPSGNEPLSSEVMQAELFGIQMSGIVVQTGQSWTECIEPGGRTLYEIGDVRIEGLLEILPNAIACFTYEETGTSCFRGQRAPRGYLFRSVDDGTLFHANKIQRGVKRCITSELIG